MKLLPLAAVCSIIALVGCSSTKQPTETAQITQGSSSQVIESSAASSIGLNGICDTLSPQEKAALMATISGKSIYFDFDKTAVKPEFYPVVESNATFIKTAKEPVLLQGNTDSRGSREYNLALGQRRAESVKQALIAIGTPADLIEAVSLGETKPVSAEDRLNRRVDFLYE